MSFNLDDAVEVVVEAAGKRGRKPADEVLAGITGTRDFGPYVTPKAALKALTAWQAVSTENDMDLSFSGILGNSSGYGFRVSA